MVDGSIINGLHVSEMDMRWLTYVKHVKDSISYLQRALNHLKFGLNEEYNIQMTCMNLSNFYIRFDLLSVKKYGCKMRATTLNSSGDELYIKEQIT